MSISAGFRRSAIIGLLASTMLTNLPALAQTAGDDEGPDEIVVTAQKRSENLQNVPISIQVLGTKKLEQLGVADFNDFQKQLPSLSFQTSQPGVTTIYLRGVASGGDGNHSGSLPSVGVYLDEQPVTTIGGTLDIHIYDIARIESLAGPQGTLYGASSQAGTIRIITNKPSTAGFEGAVDAELSTVRKGALGGQFEGYINAPLSGSAALRVVGWYKRAGGYIDNVPATRSFLPQPGGITINNAAVVDKNINTQDVYGGRAALKIDLDDSWTVTPTVMYQNLKNEGSFGYDTSLGDLQVNRFSKEFRKDKFVQAALTVEGKLGNWDLTYAGAYLDRKTHTFNDYTDYAEAYDAIYAGSGGLADYFYFENAAGADINPSQFINGSDHFRKLSQEFRIASPQDKRLRLVAGVFYQRQSNQIFQDYLVAGLSPLLSVNGRPGTLWLTKQKRVDRDYAGFGELSFDIAPTLTLTAGGRYYKFDNSLVGFFGFGRNPATIQLDDGNFVAGSPPPNAAGSSRTGVAGCFTTGGLTLRDAQIAGGNTTLAPAVIAGTPCTNLGTPSGGVVTPKSTKDDGFLHRLNLTWKPSTKALVYATWSRGFRPGGLNRRASIPPYAADFLTNYELGWKTSPAPGLRLNGAAYLQTWKNFQYSFLGENSFTQIQNGPNARIKGIEMDVNYTSGGLSLNAAASYTDAKTRGILCAGATDTSPTCANSSVSAARGTRLPITPKFKGSATARYEFDLSSAKAHVQTSVAHQGSASADIRTTAAASLGRLKAYTTADFSIGFTWRNFTTDLFVDNIFDTRGQLSRFQQCGQCTTRTYIVPIDPRTIGIRVGTKF
jgi:outer membrane receptor protein involved in Fe transport